MEEKGTSPLDKNSKEYMQKLPPPGEIHFQRIEKNGKKTKKRKGNNENRKANTSNFNVERHTRYHPNQGEPHC